MLRDAGPAAVACMVAVAIALTRAARRSDARQMTTEPQTTVAERHVPPPLVTAADLAWRRYASTCRLGGTPAQRAWAYGIARKVQVRLWIAEGVPAGDV